MADIKVIGRDKADGFELISQSGNTEDLAHDNWNTVTNVLRNRSKMLTGLGYLYLDSDTNGYLDTNRLL